MENYQEAKQRYFARLENIKHLLERLSQASSENFGVAPEKVARRDMVFVHQVEESGGAAVVHGPCAHGQPQQAGR